MLVKDVEEFPGHIACDGDSKSEIVVPILKAGKVRDLVFSLLLHYTYDRSRTRRLSHVQCIGVIDVDCAEVDGFDEEDKLGLEAVAQLLADACDW